MFDLARAAGLPMLGGCDVYAHYRDTVVRAHFWTADKKPHDLDNKFKIDSIITPAPDLKKTIVILPGFTEFCEKYSKEVLCFHQRGYNVLVIDWPGQGRSGHFGKHPLAVHCDDFDHYIGAMDAVIEKVRLDGRDLILFGHSMGGHLALRYAVWRPHNVKAVIGNCSHDGSTNNARLVDTCCKLFFVQCWAFEEDIHHFTVYCRWM